MYERFIARQPILDQRLHVYAYELLFRGGPQNAFQPYANAASSVIADSISLFDLQMLTGAARAFVNVDEIALRLGAARLLPADRIVVEILETVTPTDEMLELCRELYDAGYLLALDDFLDLPKWKPFVELATFLKVDFQSSDPATREAVAVKYRGNRIALLAEKVETGRQMEEARDLGFSFFQGYFFCKPSMLETREIPGNKVIYLQLLNAVAAPELNFKTIEEILKQEPSLLYRLLRYLNSPILGLRAEIRDVPHAIAMLGEREFRRWASIFALVSLGNRKPPELVRTALTRAYFCENISLPAHREDQRSALFLMGLLSVSDALLDKPIEEVLCSVCVSDDIKLTLCGRGGSMKDVYHMLLALERADWDSLSKCARSLGCPEEQIPDAYQAAIRKALSVGA